MHMSIFLPYSFQHKELFQILLSQLELLKTWLLALGILIGYVLKPHKKDHFSATTRQCALSTVVYP